MINKLVNIITYKREETTVLSVECDICKKEYTHELNEFEIQEFTHINKSCGYGSVFGDGDLLELDICQTCLHNLLGSYIRVIEVEKEGY